MTEEGSLDRIRILWCHGKRFGKAGLFGLPPEQFCSCVSC